jgi:glyoxylase-like metal-dependent hydrolase (beta-lactamase superfamily II)
LPGEFQAIHTPGHAPGHCCFYKSKILISGDIDLASIWFGNLTCNVADYLNSIEKLKKMDIELILPSHSDPISENITQRLELYQQRLINRAEKIYELIPESPHTLGEIAEIIFQSYPEDRRERLKNRQSQFTSHFTRITTLNYLNYLESLGKIKKDAQNGEEYWERI